MSRATISAMTNLQHLFVLLRALVSQQNQLALENLALRQQLAVLRRSVTKSRVEDSDRVFWILLRRFWKEWKDSLVFVKPDTVVRWHRMGWRYYWKRRSRPHSPGRPPISFTVIHLIRRFSRDNPTWGSPHIQSELALLGHMVADSTVAKYMVRHRNPDRAQSWRTFLHNHMNTTVACDFFTVPTLFFRTLYCFVVLSHDRRKILHINVTKNPTAEWAARQLLEALPGHGPALRHLIRDRDGVYGHAFKRQVQLLGLREVITARKSPWQNPFCERVIGSIRRECTDHVIALGEKHLSRLLNEYADYYNTSRTHLSLGRNAPEARTVQTEHLGPVRSTPVLGGLHHRYARAG